ncbi:MAG TPA: ATPase, T2SS/T4P/T4SS family [Candidatus Dojkabacteria bacterium]|nr:ATPase, T2SS/T4P/T4SS family [Candidatus Dojkabacteria bacterium]
MSTGTLPQKDSSVIQTDPNSPQGVAVDPNLFASAPAATASATDTSAAPVSVPNDVTSPAAAAVQVLKTSNALLPADPAAQGLDPANLVSSSSAMPLDTSNLSPVLAGNIADKLFEKGVIDGEQLKKIKFEALNTGQPVEEIILNGNYVSSEKLTEAKADFFHMPFISVSKINIPIEVLNKISPENAKKYSAVSFEEGPTTVKVAMVDPMNIEKVRFLSRLIGKNVEPYFADPASIKAIIETKYGAQIGSEVTAALADVGEVVDVTGNIANMEQLQGDIANAPVARIINMILEYAVKYKASDVHIEPRETKLIVRNRINGVLYEKLTLPSKLASPVISRIKILSNLKIDEHRVPQDGRFQIKVDTVFVDLRVSVMPSVYGEKVVIRLLEKGGGTLSLDKTGLRGRAYQQFLDGLKKTQGIIFVTGPTGSGKTVTLASCLKIINKPEVNIMTIEDPVEIRIDGITQVQVNTDVGLTFAKGLRSFLRQDPDIIMVGEIRDTETAELAVQAALTGHLVLCTLHTNSAATAIPRLIDMSVEPFLIASTINLAAAQRLTRKICEDCKKGYYATEGEIEKFNEILGKVSGFSMQTLLEKNQGKIILYKGAGCPQCGDSGYKGRIGIFESFNISPTLSAMIISRESAQNIEAQAIKEGMITMIQDGFIKALEGTTTLEEVLRVVA